MPRSTLKLSPALQTFFRSLGKVLSPIWRGLCKVCYWLSLPPRWIGLGVLWCFRWVGLLWKKLPQGFRDGTARVYASAPIRVVRMFIFVLACVLFWILFLFLSGAFGPIIRWLAPPIARVYGYEISIQECVVRPLSDNIRIAGFRLDTVGSPRIGTDAPLISLDSLQCKPMEGYIRADNLRIGNPDTFHYAEDGDEYYAENPFLTLSLAEIKVDLETLSSSSDEIVIELIRVHGLNVLYALDYDTDNVTALTAQLMPPKTESTPTPTAEPAPTPAPESTPFSAPESQVVSAEQPIDGVPQAPQTNVRVLLADFKDNNVTVRWVIAGAVPTSIPCPIPNFVMEDMSTQEVQDQIETIITPIRDAIDTANAAINAAGKAVGAAIKTTTEVLGSAGVAIGDGAKAVSDTTESIIGGALNLFSGDDEE